MLIITVTNTQAFERLKRCWDLWLTGYGKLITTFVECLRRKMIEKGETACMDHFAVMYLLLFFHHHRNAH